jgi:hypothetical protein
MKTTIFIIDIDSTIADNDHRAGYLDKECIVCLSKVPTKHRTLCPNCGSEDHRITQSSWDKFLSPEAVMRDKPVKKAQEALFRMRELDIPFHFLTGRGENLRQVTEDWLGIHIARDPGREALVMRSEAYEGLPASVYKERALKELIRDQDLPADSTFIFMEDDPHVFRMYQQYGIVVRCPEGWEHWIPEAATGSEPSFRR